MRRNSSAAVRMARCASCRLTVELDGGRDAPGEVKWKSPDNKKHEFEVSRVYCLNDTSYFSGDQEGGLKVTVIGGSFS